MWDLCLKDGLKMKTIGTSCILCSYTLGYFSIYDDEYGHVHYDDDDEYGRVHYDDDHHHASHDTQGLQTLDIATNASSTIMGRGAKRLGFHTRTCGSCVGKYYTSNFVRTGGHPYDGFHDKSLIMSCMSLYFLTTIVGSLKILKQCECATSISGKGNASLYD